MKEQDRPNYFPECRRSKEEPTERQPRWSAEDVEKLQEMVETLREEAEGRKLNWTYIGKQLKRHATSCYNKYVMLQEPEFSELEEAKLAHWWKENCSRGRKANVDEIVGQLQPHSRRAVLLRLESVTRGSGDLEYRMPEEEFRRFEL